MKELKDFFIIDELILQIYNARYYLSIEAIKI